MRDSRPEVGLPRDGRPCGDRSPLQTGRGLPESNVIRRAQPWLGTLVEIQADAGRRSRWQLMAAVDAAFAEIAAIHRLMSRQEQGTDLQAIQAARAGESIRVDRRTAEVLRLALELRAQSGGTFDPEEPDDGPCRQHVGAPRQEAGSPGQHAGSCGPHTLAAPAWTVEGADCVRIHRAAVPDLDGIAKGYAVDRAIAVLQAHCRSATVNAGGDLRTWGEAVVPALIRSPLVAGALLRVGSLEAGAFATSLSSIDREAAPGLASSGIRDPRAKLRRLPRMTVSVAAPACAVADPLTKVVAVSSDAVAPLLARYDATAWIVEEEAGLPCVRHLGSSSCVTADVA